jgi:hypothetical protein
MRRALVPIICVASLAATAAVAAASARGPLNDEPAFRQLSSEISTALGEARFACLAPIWESSDGQRSSTESTGSNRVGFRLLVTARRALPAARRLARTHPSIDSVALVAPRYSLTSMRRLRVVVRHAMAAFPSASVSLNEFDLGVASMCPKVDIQVDGMPVVVVEPGEAPPKSEGAESLAAAQALVKRYRLVEVQVAE